MNQPPSTLPRLTTEGQIKNIGASLARRSKKADPSPNLIAVPQRKLFEDDDDDVVAPQAPVASENVEIPDGTYTLANFAANQRRAKVAPPVVAKVEESTQSVAPMPKPSPTALVAKALANLTKRK